MREYLQAFASSYAAEMDNSNLKGDEQYSIRNPLVFLFLGDSVTETLECVYEKNQKNWNNSNGLVYLHVHTKDSRAIRRDNVYSIVIPSAHEDKKTVRPGIREHFANKQEVLLQLNTTLRGMNHRISEYGRMYTSLERVHIAVVTRIDDPCNVLIQELTVLMRSIFGNNFKSVFVDLYALIQERGLGDEYAYSSSLGVSFLSECNEFQRRTYSFNEKLQVTGEGIRLPAEHNSALFDLVYLLSDKDERGIVSNNPIQYHSDIICSLNLIKNRKTPFEVNPSHNMYNNQQYLQGMPRGDGVYYNTAGFAKIKRPNAAIALSVLDHLYRRAMRRLNENASGQSKKDILQKLSAGEGALKFKLASLLPEASEVIEQMLSLMHNSVSYKGLKNLTLREAETAIFGNAADTFFTKNVEEETERKFTDYGFETQLREVIQQIVEDPLLGYPSLFAWTNQEKGNAVYELLQMERENDKRIEQARYELGQYYEERVALQPLPKLPIIGKVSTKSVLTHLLNKIYRKKIDVLYLEMRGNLLQLYIRVLEEVHDEVGVYMKRFTDLERTLSEMSRQSISEAINDFGQNVSEYYGWVVGKIMEESEGARGETFLFEDRYLGSLSLLIRENEVELLKRLAAFARKEIFSNELFKQSFEQELLERANVTVGLNTTVKTKDELYRDLYDKLNQEAAVALDISKFQQEQKLKHEERYFFGDFESEFMKYAFALDSNTRDYKLGCVHEKKQSGIEKLHLLGGFELGDILYYRNSKKYYDAYLEDGYQFHLNNQVLKEDAPR